MDLKLILPPILSPDPRLLTPDTSLPPPEARESLLRAGEEAVCEDGLSPRQEGRKEYAVVCKALISCSRTFSLIIDLLPSEEGFDFRLRVSAFWEM